MEKVIFKFY